MTKRQLTEIEVACKLVPKMTKKMQLHLAIMAMANDLRNNPERYKARLEEFKAAKLRKKVKEVRARNKAARQQQARQWLITNDISFTKFWQDQPAGTNFIKYRNQTERKLKNHVNTI